MKLAIDHYLSQLSERDELDVMLRNLLVARGFTVVKRASRGHREYGVDVAAYKRKADGNHLYLFQVKAGDLDRRAWSDGNNSVRASLEEALDKPFQSYASLGSPPERTHLVIAFNGDMRDDVHDLASGFQQNAERLRPDVSIAYWNLSTLTIEVEKSLLSEGLIPAVDSRLLKKALAFADVPGSPLAEFKDILKHITDSARPRKARDVRRLFAVSRMVTRMLAEYARQGDVVVNAVRACEMVILRLAAWCERNEVYTPTAKEQFGLLLGDYADDLGRLLSRLEPSIRRNHGLALSGISEHLEYPLRVFEVVGFTAIHALLLMHLGRDGQADACTLMDLAIFNNPASRRPLLDNHGVPIALAALVFCYSNGPRAAAGYAAATIDNLVIRKRLKRPLPELYNDIEAVPESIALGSRPETYVDSSSTLVPLLCELLLLDADAVRTVYGAARNSFDDVDLQTWYPPKGYGAQIYEGEMLGGLTETDIDLPPDMEGFRHAVSRSHSYLSRQADADDFSEKVNGFVMLIAFRHYRTPVFPWLWREFLDLGAGGPDEAFSSS